MKQSIEPSLYSDPQDAPIVCFCSRCGGARYAPSLICIRCERDMP